MNRWSVVVALLAPALAQADHADHGEHAGHENAGHTTHGAHGGHEGHALLGGMHDHESSAVILGVLTASYKSPLYDGSYQALFFGGRWARGRFGVSLTQMFYRLERNGDAEYGLGDLLGHVHATAIRHDDLAVGAMVMVTAPIGADREGFGMGHVMLMPELWATYTPGSIAVAINAGYGYMFGGSSAHAEHGVAMWPLVDPMYAMEVTFGGTAMVPIAQALGLGARVTGGYAVGDSLDAVDEAGGDAEPLRLATGGRAVWIAGDWITTFEVLGGVAGDPFGYRGMLETARRF